MDIEAGTLVRLNTYGYSDCDGTMGIIVKIQKDFFVATDWLFKIFFFDKNEIRWYKRNNLEIVA